MDGFYLSFHQLLGIFLLLKRHKAVTARKTHNTHNVALEMHNVLRP